MKPKQMMLFAFAIGCGLIAMIGAQQILSGNKPVEQEMVKILVAKVDIDPGIPLDKSNVAFKEWPKDNIPEGAIATEEEYAEHALKIRVSPNMPVLIPYLGPKGQVGVSSMIAKGMQLVTLPVDLTQTHSGLLRPGSFVSVSCTIDRPGRDGKQNSTVKTVLQRVKVIAVGDRLAGTDASNKEPNAPKAENISFVTFPRQAKLLYLAKHVSNGRMQYAMLGESDNSKDADKDLDEADLEKRSNELAGDKANELMGEAPTAPKLTSTSKRPTGSSFSEYLKQQPVAQQVADLGKRPSKATWRIKIYNGDKVDVQELEVPEEPVEVAPITAPPVTEQWTAPLMQFFSRKRSVKQLIQETQSSPANDERPDSSNDKSAARPVDAIRK